MAKKILIVDDEEDIRTTMETILTDQGYSVITAPNADEGLKKAESEKPDLVLMDIMLPGTPVQEIVPRIKSKVAYVSVVRTSEAEREELLASKNLVGFIQKPFDINSLIKQVKKWSR